MNHKQRISRIEERAESFAAKQQERIEKDDYVSRLLRGVSSKSLIKILDKVCNKTRDLPCQREKSRWSD